MRVSCHMLCAMGMMVVASGAAIAQDADLPNLPAAIVPSGEVVPVDAILQAGELAREQEIILPETAVTIASSVQSGDPNADKKTRFSPSYGGFNASVLFNGQQIDQMKKILFLTEKFAGKKVVSDQQKSETQEIALEDLPQEEKINPPTDFPAYAISSIIYRSKKDWVFWLNGERVTPETPFETMKVHMIGPRSVEFIWEPENADSFNLYQEVLEKADPPKTLAKLMSENGKITPLEGNKWRVMLKPNQTFDTRYMAVLEGRNPAVDEVEVRGVLDNIAPPSPEEILRRAGFPQDRENMDDQLRNTLADMEDRGRRLSGFAGQKRSNASQKRSSGIHSDANLPSDVTRTAPAAPASDAEMTPQEKIAEALPKLLETIGAGNAKPASEDASNAGLPLLPSQ